MPAPETYVIRCTNCGGFLIRVTLVATKPGSKALLQCNTNCRNRGCREEQDFQVLVDDTPERSVNGSKLQQVKTKKLAH